MSPAPDPLSQAKAALRREASERRDVAHAALGAAAADGLVRLGLDRLAAFRPKIIAGFWPMRSEIDVRPLMLALAEVTGAKLALPLVLARGAPLAFRHWRPGIPLVQGPFGTSHPGDREVVLVPNLILVPLLAFDRERNRLGYGAGFYDNTLAGLRKYVPVTAVGVAYAAQEVSAVPVGEHDERLDLVLTETGFI